MMAQHTNARTADRGCCRPCRPRGSGTAARKERMLPAGWASMRCLHAENPRCGRLPYREDLSYPPQAQSVKSPAVILTRNGLPLMSVKDVTGSDWESVSLSSDPRFMAIIEESRRSYLETGGIALDEIRRELGLDEDNPATVNPQQ